MDLLKKLTRFYQKNQFLGTRLSQFMTLAKP